VIDQPPANWKRGLLNGFIAAHAALLFLWGLPGNQFTRTVAAPAQRYVIFAGLWHTWSMFAPSPYKLNYDMRARVEFKDGSTREWIWPRMEELSLWERIPKERFRKWRELMFNESYAGTWHNSARFVARQVQSLPSNPPVKVTLTRWWRPVPPPNLKRDYQPRPTDNRATHSYCIGTYAITAKDLQ
jgi:hypothetical protein